MNMYRITRLDTHPETGRTKVEELATVEGRNALDALDRFTTDRGVREHFMPQGRKRYVALGIGSLQADKL
jgi:hypothetical protein